MKIRACLFLSILLSFWAMGSAAYGYGISYGHDESQIKIADDSTGGDCSSIGQWNPETRTCTMDQDISGLWGVWITSDGLTLDGNGHTISGQGRYRGIDVISVNDVTVKNVVISSYAIGINLGMSSGCKIVDNLIVDNSFPQYSWNSASGIQIYDGTANLISGNTIRNNGYGIWFKYAPGNIIVNNQFIDNPTSNVNDWNGYENIYNLEMPIGGNHWSDYDTDSDGCKDWDEDGVCDAPYYAYLFNSLTGRYDIYQGVVDYLPWMSAPEISVPVDIPPGSDDEPSAGGDAGTSPPEDPGTPNVDNGDTGSGDDLGCPKQEPGQSEDITLGEFVVIINEMADDKRIAEKGIATSLAKSLENAAAAVERGSLNAATRQVEAFVHKVNAQAGKKISSEAADELLEKAGLLVHNL